MNVPLGLPTAPPLEVWEELSQEAQRYTLLLDAWKNAGPTKRKALDAELGSSLSHLRVHTAALDDALEEAMELADRLEERELSHYP